MTRGTRIPAGDMQSGNDRRVPAGDMNDGDDARSFLELAGDESGRLLISDDGAGRLQIEEKPE